MTEVARFKAPQLSAIQIAWLQEIGIDKRMLSRYAADRDPFPAAETPTQQAQERLGHVSNTRPDAAVVAAPGLVRASAVLEAGPQGASLPIPDTFDALQAHIAACQVCDLHSGRSQTVFGTGVVQSPAWLIVGEAPGELDDREGLPFQGRPGVLLQAMLASIGVAPETEVFFTNLVKCRPLGNRTPEPQEIAACMPYLQRQIALLQPRRILALGKLAAQALLGVDTELEQLRGQVHYVHSETGQRIPLVATYHPASLLLRPQHKADAWVDLNLARAMLVE